VESYFKQPFLLFFWNYYIKIYAKKQYINQIAEILFINKGESRKKQWPPRANYCL